MISCHHLAGTRTFQFLQGPDTEHNLPGVNQVNFNSCMVTRLEERQVPLKWGEFWAADPWNLENEIFRNPIIYYVKTPKQNW